MEGVLGTGLMPGVFAQAGMEYAFEHGVTREQFAKVAVKNHQHSALNPFAQYRTVFSLGGGSCRRGDLLPEHVADVLPDR